MADPAIAARLLGVTAEALMEGSDGGWGTAREGTLLGALFESLVTLSVRVYAQACEARVLHLRTHGGEHEVDLIVERADGRIVAFEARLSAAIDDRDVAHLRWLADRTGPGLLDAAVITTGAEAYRRRDDIAVIPAALLSAAIRFVQRSPVARLVLHPCRNRQAPCPPRPRNTIGTWTSRHIRDPSAALGPKRRSRTVRRRLTRSTWMPLPRAGCDHSILNWTGAIPRVPSRPWRYSTTRKRWLTSKKPKTT